MAEKSANVLIFEMSQNLADGEQLSGLVCPFCEGGINKDKSFSINRKFDKIYYTCHRASCNRSGVAPGGIVQRFVRQPKTPASRYRTAISTAGDIPAEIKRELEEKCHMVATDFARLDAKWISEMKRLAVPIVNRYRVVIGYALRSYDKNVKPKTINVINSVEEPLLSWYRNYTSNFKRIIVVEDQISACRAANVSTSVSLCGTNMNLLAARRIAEADPEHVVVCLDGDAFAKGLEIQNKWGGMFKKCTVCKPEKDLKNMNVLEIRDFINSQFGGSYEN